MKGKSDGLSMISEDIMADPTAFLARTMDLHEAHYALMGKFI
jgi:hypothetical protein